MPYVTRTQATPADRVTAWCAGACAILLLAGGCATPRRTLPAGAQPPFMDAELQDGDLILSRHPSPVSAVLARHGATPGPYSHAVMVYHDSAGRTRVLHLLRGGLKTPRFEHWHKRYVLLRLVRAQAPRQIRDGLGREARKLVAKNAEDPLLFDLDLRDVRSRNDRFFCLGLVNELYRRADLPVPFTLDPPPLPSMWFRIADSILGWHLEQTPTANSVLGNAAFETLAQWQNPRFPPDHLLVRNAVADRGRHYICDGYRLRPASGLTKASLNALNGLGMISDRLEELAALETVFRSFADAVGNAYRRDLRNGNLDGLSRIQRQTHAENLCDRYRDRFFRPPERPPAVGNQPSRAAEPQRQSSPAAVQ